MSNIVKICKKHGELRILDCQIKTRKLSNGDSITRYECLQCCREIKRKWAKENPDKIKAQYLKRYIDTDQVNKKLKCVTCREEKFSREFYKSQRNFSSPRCALCIRKYTSSYYKKNKEKYKKINKIYVEKTRDKVRERLHKSKLKIQYGLTVNEYNDILEKQKGVCAICINPEYKVDKRYNILKRLSVDHCHKTGKIRGLLCDDCNKALGGFKDSIKILETAIKYLIK